MANPFLQQLMRGYTHPAGLKGVPEERFDDFLHVRVKPQQVLDIMAVPNVQAAALLEAELLRQSAWERAPGWGACIVTRVPTQRSHGARHAGCWWRRGDLGSACLRPGWAHTDWV